jgi:hypothetical protein
MQVKTLKAAKERAEEIKRPWIGVVNGDRVKAFPDGKIFTLNKYGAWELKK